MPRWERCWVDEALRPDDAELMRWVSRSASGFGLRNNLHLRGENTWAPFILGYTCFKRMYREAGSISTSSGFHGFKVYICSRV